MSRIFFAFATSSSSPEIFTFEGNAILFCHESNYSVKAHRAPPFRRQPKEIREAAPNRIVLFLDAGRGVDQTHLRAALANALVRIESLEKRVLEIETKV
jgi:hypothetical protein